jgi:hypothetical protein
MVKKASTGSITSKMAMSAPASARPSAKARPQPRAPPVTRAVRPLSENLGIVRGSDLNVEG